MPILQALKLALSSILANKLRSVLTMLGIIIGVTAVIALVSIGQGATKSVTDRVASLGTNLLTININGRGSTTTINYEEAAAFAKIAGVKYASPATRQSMTVKAETKDTDVAVTGVTPAYLAVRDYKLAQGRFISQLDLEFYQKIAVLGSSTAEELFGTVSPVGQKVLINGKHYKVVGVLEEKGSSLGGSNDDIVMIPITSSERLFQSKGVSTVYVQADDGADIDTIKAALETKLAKMFRNSTDAYNIFNQADVLATFDSVSTTLSIALGGIAGISLLVGGIGIMNIMLVSVSERTREIGIRKAIGAKKKDIMTQFLIEAVVLSGLGGVIGVLAGVSISVLVSALTSLTTELSFTIIAVAFGFSVVIGVIFGVFPANKAAKLKPIEALRFE